MRAFILGSILLASCGPSEKPAVTAPPAPVTSTTAPPPVASAQPATQEAGVPLVAMREKTSRVVSFRVVFAAGSSDDPKGKEGVTSLAADMTAGSGTKELDFTALTKKLYPFSAEISSSTDRDMTVFEAEVPEQSLTEFYPLLRDVLLSPRMDEESFNRLKSRAQSALGDDLRGANDEELGKEMLQATLYDGHPYGHPSVGTETGLASITLADVQAQRANVFCKERVTVGIAGGFPEGFDATFARDLAKLPACKGPRAELPAPKKSSGLKVVIVDKPTADATAVSIGFPTDMTRASDDYPAVFFFASYLGLHRQSSGVLYQQLRESRGFNYGDYAYAEYYAQEGWERQPRANIARRQQIVSLWLRPLKPANALFGVRGALYFYRKYLSEGVSESELARYRAFTSRYFALEQQTESRRLGYAIDDLAYGLKQPWLTRMRAAWQSLDAAKLKAIVAKRLTGNDLTIVLVAKDAAALKKRLLDGKPTPPTYDAPKPKSVTDVDKEIEKLPLGLKDEDITIVPISATFH
jgi:zinc protease